MQKHTLHLVYTDEEFAPSIAYPKDYPGSVGIDVVLPHTVYLAPGEFKAVNLGVKVNFIIDVEQRSSLFKKGVMIGNGTGIIDANYRGDVHIILHCPHGKTLWGITQIEQWERIAQIIPYKIKKDGTYSKVLPQKVTIEKVSQKEYDNFGEFYKTERAEGWMGSSGV